MSAVKVPKLEGERTGHGYRSALTLSNVAQLYNPLTSCFKYLTVRDLLRVSMSCKYLNRIASEPSLVSDVEEPRPIDGAANICFPIWTCILVDYGAAEEFQSSRLGGVRENAA